MTAHELLAAAVRAQSALLGEPLTRVASAAFNAGRAPRAAELAGFDRAALQSLAAAVQLSRVLDSHRGQARQLAPGEMNRLLALATAVLRAIAEVDPAPLAGALVRH